jgi:coatomer subunit beta
MSQVKKSLTLKEKPCYIYIDQEPLTSYREVTKKISSKDIKEKEEGLKTLLGSMVNDDNYPQDIMINAIHHLTIVDDIRVKKLLFLFWEIVEKTNKDGKIKEEFILVCNTLRKDLDSPNEYIRGRTLRLLTKLPMPEILENLKSAVFENLNHNHPYVKSNALMCTMSFINNFGSDCVPDSMPDQLKDIILKDNDTATRRNAYLVLSKIAPMESLELTQEIMENNEISELGDLFALCIAENLKKLCKSFPNKTSIFINLLLELSVHKSHSVLFEISSILLEVSSSPNIVSTAVNILCSLLHEERDNNTLVIILKKLIGIKNKHKEILQEQILTFATLINLNYAKELRKIAFQLINELVTEANITQVFDKFIETFTQLNAVNENENTIELKNMISKCIILNIKKYPNIDKNYPLFLLGKSIFSKKDNVYLYSQISFIRELFDLYSNVEDEKSKLITNEMLKKIIHSFEDIDTYEIMQICIWVLSNYSNDLETLKNVFDLIMKNLGDLNFEYSSNKILLKDEENDESEEKNQKRTITKTVILEDGTYGTITQVVDAKEVNKNKDSKYLRKFLLESNFYFSANLVSALTNIIFKMKKYEDFNKYKIYFYNTINIICSILKMNSDKIFKDPDNINHIQTCLKFLLSNDDSIFQEWNNEFMKITQNQKNLNKNEKHEEKKLNNQPDTPINFRHCKIYDPDNFDVGENQIEDNNIYSNKLLDEEEDDEKIKKRKFIEVLTGTQDPIFVECEVEIFTFDLTIDFYVKNKTKNTLQNVSILLYVPNEFSIIEKPPQFTLNPNEQTSVRACIKFSKTINAYIYGQVSFSNFKGENSFYNLSGLFIELMNTFQAEISDLQFRKFWNEYTWEHNVMLVSRKKSFKDIINDLCKELKMKLVFPNSVDSINEDDPFLVANLYSKTKLGEDALVNLSVEKGKDKKILGTCVLRSKTKDFMTSLGEKIKALIS